MTIPVQYSEIIDDYFHKHIVIPELAQEISLEGSIVIQQIHYWLQRCGKSIEGQLWIYNTFEQWQQNFRYWSISKIKKIFYSLEKQGFISSKKMNVRKSDHTKWYTLNYDNVIELMKNLAENFKEDTTENVSKSICFDEISEEKNFPLCQSELSLCQSDTIIYSYTKNNFHKNSYLKKTEIFSEEDEGICEQLITIWNNTFENQISLNEKRKTKLLNLWNTIINQNIEKWEEFCRKVNSSKFLMGEKKEGFKASFDWLIESNITKRVLSGEFGSDRKDPLEERIKEKKQEEKESKVIAIRDNLNSDEKRVFDAIRSLVYSRFYKDEHGVHFANEVINGDFKILNFSKNEEVISITIQHRYCFKPTGFSADIRESTKNIIKEEFSEFKGKILVSILSLNDINKHNEWSDKEVSLLKENNTNCSEVFKKSLKLHRLFANKINEIEESVNSKEVLFQEFQINGIHHVDTTITNNLFNDIEDIGSIEDFLARYFREVGIPKVKLEFMN